LALDGSRPTTGLVQGRDGFFYGTTVSGGSTDYYSFGGYGTVFKISTNGLLNSLYLFGAVLDTNGSVLDGWSPNGLVQSSDGNFYGTTYGGDGTAFKISPNGVLTTLYSFQFNSHSGHYYPVPNGLVQGSDGYFYGATRSSTGGSLGYDGGCIVFRISTNGVFTPLLGFPPPKRPDFGTIIQGSDGSFYGTTSMTAPIGPGTIFRLTIVPELQAMTHTNGMLNLTWSTEAGGIYQLQASASLNPPNWTNLCSPVTATNGTLTFTDAVTNAPQRFYRVSLAP
jgi:uncharacterized repeat protein (TIGR03803 family)